MFAFRLISLLLLVSMVVGLPSLSRIYSIWYCGDDQCLWQATPNLNSAGWIVNRGDGRPTANLVIFSFINPLSLLQGPDGIPSAFTQNAVDFFKNKNMYVIFSIGGASYSTDWDQALAQNPSRLAQNAATVAKRFGVGIEIDYETDSAISLQALDTFVQVYRSFIRYDDSDSPVPESILTVDLGAGTGYLTSLSRVAWGWLNSSVVNWANAMVTGDPNGDNRMYWQQHLDGANWAQLPPMNPRHLVGSLYASSSAHNCPIYDGTVLPTSIQWVQDHSARGLSFWAAGCPGPNNCANFCPGIQQGSKVFLK